jgi:hypothetical protein
MNWTHVYVTLTLYKYEDIGFLKSIYYLPTFIFHQNTVNNKSEQQTWSCGNALNLYSGSAVQIMVGSLAIKRVFWGFPQVLQARTRAVPLTHHKSFFLNHFQYNIHKSIILPSIRDKGSITKWPTKWILSKITFLWDVMYFSLVDCYQHSEETSGLHLKNLLLWGWKQHVTPKHLETIYQLHSTISS